MKHLNIPLIREVPADASPGIIACQLIKRGKNLLEFAPWSDYPYKPEVYFSVAYGTENLYLHYEVKEKHVAAVHGKTNSPVYEDSCVEFFISFGDDLSYYNFEFNCIGTALVGYGTAKTDRTLLPDEVMKKINYQVLHQNSKEDALRQWELSVVIPFDVFLFHSISSLKGEKGKANFYKCGDHLPEPHFLSWSNVESEAPDFHMPASFGTLLFT